uniref:Uncharacterized protein n=1 Tax=Fagus sylvatica TaxID=28930 RepID=A0A2N9FQM9_FAGSY
MQTGEVRERSLTGTEFSMDFPMINGNFIGIKNRYGYTQVINSIASSTSGLIKFGGLAKLYFEELDTRFSSRERHQEELIKVEYHMFEENIFCTGAAFVSKEGSFEEDDGWIITFVHNEDTDVSEVYIIDTKNFSSEPVAKIRLPCRVPMEYYRGRRSLFSFMDEERDRRRSPTHLSIETHQEIYEHDHQSSPELPCSPQNTMHTIMAPPSPESPWTLSPLQTPSPSLLYHCIASLHRHEGTIYSITVSKGVVFTGSESSRIHAWKQPDCMERGHVKTNCGEVRAILAYGNMLFSAHKDHKIRIWNFMVSDSLRSKKVSSLPRKSSFLLFPRTNTQQHKHCVSCMAYYHAEGLLYTGSHDRTVKAWRVSDKKCVDSFVAHEDNVTSILVNQDDGCVFTSSSDGSVKIWRRVYMENSHTLTMILRFQPSPINALALSPSFNNNHCFLYSDRRRKRLNHGGSLQGHRFSVLCLVAIEKLIFSGSEDTTIRIWRREEGGKGRKAVVRGKSWKWKRLQQGQREETHGIQKRDLVYSRRGRNGKRFGRGSSLENKGALMVYTMRFTPDRSGGKASVGRARPDNKR